MEHSARAKRVKTTLPEHDTDMLSLQSLTRQRRAEEDAVKRQTLSLQMCRVRRRVNRRTYSLKCEQAVENIALVKLMSKKPVQTTVFLKRGTGDDDHKKSDPEAMPEMLTEFFADLFSDSDGALPPQWIFKSWCPSVLRTLPAIDCYLVRQAIEELRRNKRVPVTTWLQKC